MDVNDIINIIDQQDEILLSEKIDILNIMFLTIDINTTTIDDKENSFLHYCIINNNYEITEYLLDKGINSNIQNKNGETALLMASRKGYFRFVKLLLQYGANPDIYEKNGQDSPLLWASYYGHLEIVIFLIENGANPYHKYRDGRDAIRWAVRENHYLIVDYLLQYLKDLLYRDIYSETIMDMKTNYDIKSLLNSWIEKNNLSVIHYFINNQNEITEYKLVEIIGNYYYSDFL
jgi:ankyrin repeat protein